MSKPDYSKDIFRQLQDVMNKCDNLSQEIRNIKAEHTLEIHKLKKQHKNEVDALNEKINSLEKENLELKEEIDILNGKTI